MIKEFSERSVEKKVSETNRHKENLRGYDHCHRCGGLMIKDYCIDLQDETGQIDVTVIRCIQCGDVVDPIILRNRLHPEYLVKRTTSRRMWPKPQGLRQIGT